MSTTKLTVLLSILLLASSEGLYAGDLEKRSRIELRMGLRNQGGKTEAGTQVGPVGVETTAESDGILVSLAYAYTMRENVAVHATLGVLAVEASARIGLPGIFQRAGVICPLILGMRYYMPWTTLQTPFRPFLTVGIGPNIGVESKNDVGLQLAQKSTIMTSFGSQAGGGLDVRLGRSVVAIANLGYNLMTDFSEPLGDRLNYSGLEFGVGIAWLFGRSVEQ